MQVIRYVVACVALVMVAGCKPAGPAVEGRWRFVGGDTLARQTNAPVLARTLNLKEAAAARPLLVTNVARLLWQWTTGDTNVPARALESGVTVAQHLLSQLSIGEVYRGGGGTRDWAVGFPARDGVEDLKSAWTNFFALARPSAKPEVTVSGAWLVAVSDAAQVDAKEALGRLAKIPAEPGDALRLELNAKELPAVSLVAALRDGAVKTTAKVTLADQLPALPAWEIPELARDPLVGFTASRGVHPLLTLVPALQDLFGAEPVPQLFVWSQQETPLHTYLAARTDKATNIFNRLVLAAQEIYSKPVDQRELNGVVTVETNYSRLSLHELPGIRPAMGPLSVKGKDYFYLRLFPEARSTNPPPAELLQQLNRPNVAYFDWEITAANVPHWTMIDQTTDMWRGHSLGLRGAAARWLTAASPLTENCVTEALVTGERELTVTRKSQLGLSSLELVKLCRWLATVDRSRQVAPGFGPAKPAKAR